MSLSQLQVDSLVSYLIAFLLPACDAIVPVLPSEAAVIALGVATSGSSDPRIVVLVALSAAGAFVGDNVSYALGRRFAPFATRHFLGGSKGQQRREWAERSLERFGARLILICRFIPGGRTAVTLTCGIVGYRRRTFVIATAAAGVVWATYAFSLGRFGGKSFEDRPWAGFLLAFGGALVISLLVELMRRVSRWLTKRQHTRP